MEHNPRIIFFDLETLPDMEEAMEIWTGIGDFPGRTFKATINSIISFGYRDYDKDKKAKCINAWDFKGWKKNVNDDRELCKVIYETLKDANIVVTQNGKRFDWKFVQTRLIKHGFNILPKIKHVDLKVLASSNLLLYSNSLKEMARFLDTDRKLAHEGWSLWVKTRKRDPEAMAMMNKYCKQDVDAMVPIFEKFRPFMKEINYNLYRLDASDCCPSCGGFDFRSDGIRFTKTHSYRRLFCKGCKTWIQGDPTKKISGKTLKQL